MLEHTGQPFTRKLLSIFLCPLQGAAVLTRPKKRPRSVPLGKSNLSNVSTLPHQAASSAACLPVKATDASADAQMEASAIPPAPALKFPVRNKRTEQPR